MLLANIDRVVRLVLEEFTSSSSPSVENVNNAINNHERVIISYDGNGKDKFKGPRMVDIYAYGLTRAGNPVIRGFQQYPHQSKTIKGWKFFRLDRITSWRNTGQKFYKPDSFSPFPEFNKSGDRLMSVVYNIAKFDDDGPDASSSLKPKMKYRTSTETGLEKLRNAVTNPIYLKDLKKSDSFAGSETKPSSSGPKTKNEKPYNKMNQKERDEYRAWKQHNADNNYNINKIYKNIENQEPEDKLSDKYFSDREKSYDRLQKERDKRALGITGEVTPEKLANAKGSVDRMNKYRKGSANDYLNQFSKEELDKAIERLRKEQNNG